MSYRRLGVLIRHLPADSATRTAMRDALTPEQYADLAARPAAGHGPWSRTDMLLAAVLDAVRVGNFHFAAAHGAKGARPPEPIRRPGVDGGNVHPLNEAGRVYLQRLRENRGGA
jgi:hypothetical protein